ncbi:death ligand signal enhancer isoform X1 [Prionailurus iriomotensis]
MLLATTCGASRDSWAEALPRLLGPGFRGLTPKSTNPNDPQAASSTLLVPVSSFDSQAPMAQAQARTRAQGLMDGRMPSSGCLPVSPQTPCGMPYHGQDLASPSISCLICKLVSSAEWSLEGIHAYKVHKDRDVTIIFPSVPSACCNKQGTLAVLALQLARQIHFQSSLPAGPRQAEHRSWRRPLDCFLSSPLWHPRSSLRRHILPSSDGPAARHTGLREPRLGQEEPSTQPENLSSYSSVRASGLQGLSEEDPSDLGFLHASSSFRSGAKPAQPVPTGQKQEQDKSKTLSLEEAVTSIQQLFQLSVSIAFNFLGTENMRNGDYTAAFSYFQKAADRGYSKAQYNVGLCHEHGRGTPRDLGKAVLFYQLAASQGHRLAQYRYARCLLQGPASTWDPECQRAVSMLKQAAHSGLREAQAFLGVLFTKEPHLDEQRAVKYLWLAANNGDSQSRYHLGICYEKGLGVQRNLGEAIRCYQQSAALGNEPARERLRTLFSMEAVVKVPWASTLCWRELHASHTPRAQGTLASSVEVGVSEPVPGELFPHTTILWKGVSSDWVLAKTFSLQP